MWLKELALIGKDIGKFFRLCQWWDIVKDIDPEFGAKLPIQESVQMVGSIHEHKGKA